MRRVGWLTVSATLISCGGGSQQASDASEDASDDVPDAGALLFQDQTYIKASNTDSEDQFGSSVALSDDGLTLAIGAYREASAATGVDGDQADNSASGSGAVYVFVRSGDVWSQQAYIKATNTNAGDVFSMVSLSADGNTLAIGAQFEASAATGIDGSQVDNTAQGAGAVYIYLRTGTLWSPQAFLKASNTDAGDQFGASVALSNDGNTLVVGAHYEASAATGIDGDQTNDSILQSGAVYVFARNGGSWAQQAYIKASNTGLGDQFGRKLAISADGNSLAVAAASEDSASSQIGGNELDNSRTNSGAVYIFTRAGTSWSQQEYIKPFNPDYSDYFGTGVALSDDGNTLAVGAYSEDSAATGIDGDPGNNWADFTGAVYLFDRAGTTWTQRHYVKASNPDPGDGFGEHVALSGDGRSLAVHAAEASSATGLDGNQSDNSAEFSGAVYFFTATGSSWVQQHYIKPSYTRGGETFGSWVSLSTDGRTLAVGARFENSAATGIGGDPQDSSATSAGAAYVLF